MRPYKLEHIRILLVGHDAGAGRHVVRQMYESEILARIETAVRRKFANRLSHSSIGERYGTFRLATPHLGIYDIVVKVGESQKPGSHRPVQRSG